MERKAFRWEREGYRSALCSCEGGGGGGGGDAHGNAQGRGRGTDQGKGNTARGGPAGGGPAGGGPAGGRGNSPGATAAGISAAAAARDAAARDSAREQARSAQAREQARSAQARESASRNTAAKSAAQSAAADAQRDAARGWNSNVSSPNSVENAMQSPAIDPFDKTDNIALSKTAKTGAYSPGFRAKIGQRNVPVHPGAHDAKDTKVSFLAGLFNLTDDERQHNLNNAAKNKEQNDPETGGGPQKIKKETEDVPEDEASGSSPGSSHGQSSYPSSSSGMVGTSALVDAGEAGVAINEFDKKLDSLLDLIEQQQIDAAKVNPYGLEDTRITKSQLTDANLTNSSLTMAGVRQPATGKPVVDPVTGTSYANPAAARSAGITNWVYKYVWDSKKSGSSLYTAVTG